MAEYTKGLRIYHQALMGEDLKAEARKPTNMTKIYNVKQGKDENPGADLERLIDGGF